jgi:hypothetical protein
MGVIDMPRRLKACKRQKMLFAIHCKECINKNAKNDVKVCTGCAIYDEFRQIGKVLNETVRGRVVGR